MPKFIMLEDGDYVNTAHIVAIGVIKLHGSKKYSSVECPEPYDTWEVQAFITPWNTWHTLLCDVKEFTSEEKALAALAKIREYLES